MTRAQEYICNMMENVAEGHIASDNHRLMFAKIKEKLSESNDFEAELISLYKVHGFDEFVLSLMWIAELVETNPSKTEYQVEEQGLVVDRFREAVGDVAAAPLEDLPQPEVFAAEPEVVEAEPGTAELEPEESAPEVVEEAQPETREESVEMPDHLQMETSGPIDESEKAVYAAATNVDESEFGPLIERFIEAMQSGSEDREQILGEVMAHANAISAQGSGAADDLREFCQYLVEFLTYISENDFMDDVRVMNILSNVSSPVSSWAEASAESREGLLAEGIEMLKTFKSLFE